MELEEGERNMSSITQFFKCFNHYNSFDRYQGLVHLTYSSSFPVYPPVQKWLEKEKLHFPGSFAGRNGGPGSAAKIHAGETWRNEVINMRVATLGETGSSWQKHFIPLEQSWQRFSSLALSVIGVEGWVVAIVGFH